MRLVFMGAVIAAVGACASDRPLHEFRSISSGPDDFSVIPLNPLVIPDTLDLPPPTPGGTNRTDPNPEGQAIVALGGNPAAARAGGVPASDAAIVAATARFGVTPDIRAALAQSDAAFRARQSRGGLFSLFGGDRYYAAYAPQALDAYAVLNDFRNLGVATPSAPPQ